MTYLPKKLILILFQHNNIEDKLTKEFEEYFQAFIEKLDSDTSNFIESREKSRSDNFINCKFLIESR